MDSVLDEQTSFSQWKDVREVLGVEQEQDDVREVVTRWWDKSKMVLFIEKAFDRVKRQAMWSTVRDEDYSIPGKIVIESIYMYR